MTSVHERLKDDFEVTAFWYNPNIEPREEYDKRLDNFSRYCIEQKVKTIVSNDRDYEVWRGAIKGLENEPEGGERCSKCIYVRLRQTAITAKAQGFDVFATTLSVSPHKNADLINRIGSEISKEFGAEYLISDFKKNEGYKRSIELSREYELYRQNYCGCSYSMGVNQNNK